MAEYIRRDYAIDAALDVYYDTPDIDLSGEKFEAAILKIPAADVAPVRHGFWKLYERAHYFKCSLCAETVPYRKACLFDGRRKYNYCPNCGADMRGSNDE